MCIMPRVVDIPCESFSAFQAMQSKLFSICAPPLKMNTQVDEAKGVYAIQVLCPSEDAAERFKGKIDTHGVSVGSPS